MALPEQQVRTLPRGQLSSNLGLWTNQDFL